MKPVLIVSPYAGETDANIAYAKQCLSDSINHGEAPFASHLLYPLVLDDNRTIERGLGLRMELCWLESARPHVVVYTDRGLSSGMEQTISHAAQLGLTVEFRKLNEKMYRVKWLDESQRGPLYSARTGKPVE